MRPSTQKIVLILFLFAALHLAEACIDCGCGHVLPFFDYQALVLDTPETEIASDFKVNIKADSVSYLAVTEPRLHFHLSSSAWACSCNFSGDSGPKYAIDKLNIYADRAFNDTLPAGASLNTLFWALNGDAVTLLQKDAANHNFWAFGDSEESISAIELLTHEKPKELNVPFTFRVEIVKSNGTTLSAETGEIVFK
ncbi:MAG TPA: hypothetical protein VK168_00435 [Saprospiraceae bacterium]|nr:hypothetical protein [Saprospiraceae bacterium]